MSERAVRQRIQTKGNLFRPLVFHFCSSRDVQPVLLRTQADSTDAIFTAVTEFTAVTYHVDFEFPDQTETFTGLHVPKPQPARSAAAYEA
ncbi:MAG: hypothetical protein ABGZ35_22025 [Planctomycetaceae bacterium]